MSTCAKAGEVDKMRKYLEDMEKEISALPSPALFSDWIEKLRAHPIGISGNDPSGVSGNHSLDWLTEAMHRSEAKQKKEHRKKEEMVEKLKNGESHIGSPS